MSTTTKHKVTDIVKEARKLALDANRPMSIDEIRGNFQVGFPFQVKKVVNTGRSAPKKLSVGETWLVLDFCTDGWYVIYNDEARHRTPGNVSQWVLV